MKIYSLVRTELHNQTELEHFPTMEAAQKKMLEECSKIVGEEINELHNDYITEDGMWYITSDNYYATLSNGNKIEFEIFERVIDLKDYLITEIADKVVTLYPDCKDYRGIILDVLSCFGDKELPRMVDEEIINFIYTVFQMSMSCTAADVINEEYGDDEIHQLVFDYLEGNRGVSFMAKIINREEPATMELKDEINKDQKREIFKTDYVWVAKSHTDEGEEFRRKEEIKVFNADSYDSALKYMQKKYHAVKGIFIDTAYMNEDIVTYDDGKLFQVHSKDNYDCWEGTLTKVYVEK